MFVALIGAGLSPGCAAPRQQPPVRHEELPTITLSEPGTAASIDVTGRHLDDRRYEFVQKPVEPPLTEHEKTVLGKDKPEEFNLFEFYRPKTSGANMVDPVGRGGANVGINTATTPVGVTRVTSSAVGVQFVSAYPAAIGWFTPARAMMQPWPTAPVGIGPAMPLGVGYDRPSRGAGKDRPTYRR